VDLWIADAACGKMQMLVRMHVYILPTSRTVTVIYPSAFGVQVKCEFYAHQPASAFN